MKLQNTWKGHGAGYYVKGAKISQMQSGHFEITSPKAKGYQITFSPGDGRGKTQWITLQSWDDVVNLRCSDAVAKKMVTLQNKIVEKYRKQFPERF